MRREGAAQHSPARLSIDLSCLGSSCFWVAFNLEVMSVSCSSEPASEPRSKNHSLVGGNEKKMPGMVHDKH